MAAATKLGLGVSVSPVGGSKQDGGLTPISSDSSHQEWLTTLSPDEDAFLHQLRSALLQAPDGPIREYPLDSFRMRSAITVLQNWCSNCIPSVGLVACGSFTWGLKLSMTADTCWESRFDK